VTQILRSSITTPPPEEEPETDPEPDAA